MNKKYEEMKKIERCLFA